MGSRFTQMRAHRLAGLVSTIVLTGLFVPACETTERIETNIGYLLATYKAGKLSATIAKPPAAVMAAAEQTLRDRGYSIEQVATTQEQGGILARPPMYNLGKTLEVDVAPGPDGGSALTIWSNPWDETLTKITLQGILERLGI